MKWHSLVDDTNFITIKINFIMTKYRIIYEGGGITIFNEFGYVSSYCNDVDEGCVPYIMTYRTNLNELPDGVEDVWALMQEDKIEDFEDVSTVNIIARMLELLDIFDGGEIDYSLFNEVFPMGYRVVEAGGEDLFIITEDGGLVCYESEKNESEYYQTRIGEASNYDEMWDRLCEGKIYYKKWEHKPSDEQIVQDALQWLVVGQTNWTINPYLFTNIFNN